MKTHLGKMTHVPVPGTRVGGVADNRIGDEGKSALEAARKLHGNLTIEY